MNIAENFAQRHTFKNGVFNQEKHNTRSFFFGKMFCHVKLKYPMLGYLGILYSFRL